MKNWIFGALLALTTMGANALELTKENLESFIDVAPAVSNWAGEQDIDPMSLLGANANADSEGGDVTSSVISMLKDNEMYGQFESMLGDYGFTPEQLISVGSSISSAYFANLKGGLSSENQSALDSVMGGLKSFGGSNDKVSNALGAAGNIDTSNVSENNLSMVSEYMPQLKKVFSMFAG